MSHEGNPDYAQPIPPAPAMTAEETQVVENLRGPHHGMEHLGKWIWSAVDARAVELILRLAAARQTWEAERADIIAKADAEMERVKACEHIAEGFEGWEILRNLCPSTAAVAALRDERAALLRRIADLERQAKDDTRDAAAEQGWKEERDRALQEIEDIADALGDTEGELVDAATAVRRRAEAAPARLTEDNKRLRPIADTARALNDAVTEQKAMLAEDIDADVIAHIQECWANLRAALSPTASPPERQTK